MTGGVGGVYSLLNLTGLYHCQHTALILYLEEELPCLLCQSLGQILYVV